MNFEAIRYLRYNTSVRIPFLGREKTEYFINKLYEKHAVSVYISNILSNSFISEIIVIGTHSEYIKDILIEIFKSKPYSVEERKRNVFTVTWKVYQ